ncbi:hypothetical protein PCL_04858 [Purpureocillium lilacinum]|uniref:Uncharacterized protein n=1 Tax=Purpureocillium lilacinum TaxID=33203 RepID=A0A2U3DWT6_PURLI|nr:hypothetical protein PCL_04858 [Purpureocillium lilacinum]
MPKLSPFSSQAPLTCRRRHETASRTAGRSLNRPGLCKDALGTARKKIPSVASCDKVRDKSVPTPETRRRPTTDDRRPTPRRRQTSKWAMNPDPGPCLQALDPVLFPPAPRPHAGFLRAATAIDPSSRPRVEPRELHPDPSRGRRTEGQRKGQENSFQKRGIRVRVALLESFLGWHASSLDRRQPKRGGKRRGPNVRSPPLPPVVSLRLHRPSASPIGQLQTEKTCCS